MKMPKNGPFMTQTWASHAPIHRLFLNPNNMVHGYYMQIFRVLVWILTDIFTFLTDSATGSVTGPRCRVVHLTRGHGMDNKTRGLRRWPIITSLTQWVPSDVIDRHGQIKLSISITRTTKLTQGELAWKWGFTKKLPNMVQTGFWHGPKNRDFINMSLVESWLSLENFRALVNLKVELGQLWPLHGPNMVLV